MTVALAVAFGSTGCSLFVHFDPDRLDAASDAIVIDGATDGSVDAAPDASLETGVDAMDVRDATADARDAMADTRDGMDVTLDSGDAGDAGPDAQDATADGDASANDAMEAGDDAGDASDANETGEAGDDASDAADANDDVTDVTDVPFVPECNAPSDCPGTDTECSTRTCVLQRCGVSFVAPNTATPTQNPGDCHTNRCDGAGNSVNVVDDTDVPTDTNQCTNDVCTAGVPSHPFASAGFACSQNGGAVCDGAGACVACVAPTDCPGADTPCRQRSCTANVCGIDTLPAGTRVANQVVGDCRVNECDGAGNVLNNNDDTDVQNDGNECTTDTCSFGRPVHTPVTTGTLCNGGAGHCDATGACVSCTVGADCPGTDTECRVRSCVSGTCGFADVAAGTGCTTGGAVCDGAGACVACNAPSDCPGSDTACRARTCTAHVCGTSNAPAGTPAGSQLPGDCHQNECDGSGGVMNAVDTSDVPIDGNECTADVCSPTGVPSNPPLPAHTACAMGGNVCDGAGVCVGCIVASDCPGTDTECQVRTCGGSTCGVSNTPAGTPLMTQIPGDCRVATCNGAGGPSSAADNADVPPDDGNPCTVESCVLGMPASSPAAAGTTCNQNGGTVCNGSGSCVQCNTANDCAGSDTECSMRTCTAGVCGAANAPAGTVTSAQTPGNCQTNQCDGNGAIVPVTDNTDLPNDNNQCTSDVCMAGAPSNPPTAAGTACTQSSGTVCDGAGACVACNVNADCASGSCIGHVCTTPNCTDNVTNGTETDVDCGGGTCGGCAVGKTCRVSTDCLSGFCGANSKCQTPTLILVRIGDGTAALSSASTAVFLERYTTAGTLIGAPISVPIAASGSNHPLTMSGTATTEGGIVISPDGRYATFAGYNVAPGQASVSSSSTTVAPIVTRDIGRVDSSGSVDTSTVLGTFFSGSSVRSAATTNGTDLWAAGGSTPGIAYETLGASSGIQVETNFTNTRWLNIFEGQLYVSGASGTLQGIGTVGTGTPTTTGNTITPLPGFPTATGPGPNGFVLLDTDSTLGPDRIYLADDRATTATGGIQRWDLVAGTWTYRYSLTTTGTLGARGVTTFSTMDPVTLYATNSSGTSLVSVTDTGAASVPTVIHTAATNTLLKGVTIAPYLP